MFRRPPTSTRTATLCPSPTLFRSTGDLHADLVELPLPPLLRTLVAEHRPGIEQLQREVLAETAGNEGTGDTRGPLRPQRDRVAAAILERVHLLGDDVGRIAERSREDLGELENRRRDLAEAVRSEEQTSELT